MKRLINLLKKKTKMKANKTIRNTKDGKETHRKR